MDLRKYRIAFLLMLAVLLCAFTACNAGGDSSGSVFNPFMLPQGPQSADSLKIGFVYSDTIADRSFTASHEVARKAVERQTGVKTVYIDSVAAEDFPLAAKALIDDGCNIIIATDHSYYPKAFEVAQSYKNIWFFTHGGSSKLANLTTFEGKMYQPAYVCGAIAAQHSFSKKVGFISERHIYAADSVVNAFTLGLRLIDPEATVELIYAATAEETQLAVDTLKALGCDVIAQYQNTSECIRYSNNVGVKVIGSNTDTFDLAPDTYLVSYVYAWETFYMEQLNQIMDGIWESSVYSGGMVEGITTVGDLSKNCANNTLTILNKLYGYVMDGTITVFAGEILDNNGNVAIEEGVTLTDEEIVNMNFLVEGIRLVSNIAKEHDYVPKVEFIIKS